MRGRPSLFQSFFQGGFECSTHRRRDGRRLDVIAGTRHDELAREDYRRLREAGMRTCRDGVRWHLVEPRAGQYRFDSFLPMLRAARAEGVEVIWDLFHYGWPDDLDIFKPAFVRRFAAYARAVATVVAGETDSAPFFCPVNEISFVAWAGGDVEYLNPFHRGWGLELKTQLVRATIEAIEAVRDVLPRARFCAIDPVLHICADPSRPHEREAAERCRRGMFEAWDMIAGRSWPTLGGDAKYLDVIGVNYYWNNQWVHGGPQIRRGEPLRRPLADILQEVHERYGRPLFVSETGIEDDERPEWLAYVADQCFAALDRGVPVEGLCLYPVVNHPGWDNDRHCHNGLWDYADARGHRPAYAPLAAELRRQQAVLREHGAALPPTVAPLGREAAAGA